jgi:hypothetical protein
VCVCVCTGLQESAFGGLKLAQGLEDGHVEFEKNSKTILESQCAMISPMKRTHSAIRKNSVLCIVVKRYTHTYIHIYMYINMYVYTYVYIYYIQKSYTKPGEWACGGSATETQHQ